MFPLPALRVRRGRLGGSRLGFGGGRGEGGVVRRWGEEERGVLDVRFDHAVDDWGVGAGTVRRYTDNSERNELEISTDSYSVVE